MTTRKLLWGAMWRGAVWGLVGGICAGLAYGLVFGYVYGMLILPFVTTPEGFLLGAIGGAIFQIICKTFYIVVEDERRFEMTVRTIAFFYGIIGNLIIEVGLFGGGSLNFEIPNSIVVRSLIGGSISAIIAHYLARWYETEMKKEKQNV